MGRSHAGWRRLAYLFAVYELISGLASLGLGVYAELFRQQYVAVNGFASSPATLLIALSSFTLVVALLGFLGVRTEKMPLLRAFVLCGAVVLMFEVAIGVLAWVYREETMALTTGQFDPFVRQYGLSDNQALDSAINNLQQNFQCCGMRSYTDWRNNGGLNCSYQQGHCDLPASCCSTNSSVNGYNMGSFNISCYYPVPWTSGHNGSTTPQNATPAELPRFYDKGCKFLFIFWVESHLDFIGIGSLCFSLPQVIGIFVVHFYSQYVDEQRTLYKVET